MNTLADMNYFMHIRQIQEKTKDSKHLLIRWLNRKKNQNQFKARKLNNCQLRHVKYRHNDSLLQTDTVKSSLPRAVSLVPFTTPSSQKCTT